MAPNHAIPDRKVESRSRRGTRDGAVFWRLTRLIAYLVENLHNNAASCDTHAKCVTKGRQRLAETALKRTKGMEDQSNQESGDDYPFSIPLHQGDLSGPNQSSQKLIHHLSWQIDRRPQFGFGDAVCPRGLDQHCEPVGVGDLSFVEPGSEGHTVDMLNG